ncbi:pilus assembly PilX family protein [Arenicella xantha]|nr:pilus assembly PilX N-terminal domain-containing protein [Arenicella xantha]
MSKQFSIHKISAQRGASLLITMVVLIVLTVIAVTATNNSQTQAFMVRNNQFRLETFNASYAEIDAQIDTINKRKLSDGVPSYIIAMTDNAVGTTVTPANSDLEIYAPVQNTYMTKVAEQSYRGNCAVFGQQLGAGAEKIRCNEIKILADSKMVNTKIDSTQHQVYEYRTLAE